MQRSSLCRRLDSAEFIHIENGQIFEVWTEIEGYSFRQSIGAIPTPEREPGLQRA